MVSFGFKYGIPVDADFVADMRFLPNPHWVPELRPLHRPGRRRSPTTCMEQPGRRRSSSTRYVAAARAASPTGYLREGKRFMTVAIGCTGGKHRSVAMTEEIAAPAAARAASTPGRSTATWAASEPVTGADRAAVRGRARRRPRPARLAVRAAALVDDSWSTT